MGEVSPVPARHPECRCNGENRPEISSSSSKELRRAGRGGARRNSGGPRPNSGGPRPNSGGARSNSGGPRDNSGGVREGAGRKQRLTVNASPPPRDPAGCWLCGEVRAGREEIGAEQLRRLGFETYVPIGELPPLPGAEKEPQEVGPLFPGYVFLRFGLATLSHWNAVLDRAVTVHDAPELIGLICHGDGTPWPMLSADIERLLARTRDGVIPLPDEPGAPASSFAVGDLVAVVDGPFTSFPGTVLEVRARSFMVEVTMFGRSTPAEMLPGSIELVTPAPRV